MSTNDKCPWNGRSELVQRTKKLYHMHEVKVHAWGKDAHAIAATKEEHVGLLSDYMLHSM